MKNAKVTLKSFLDCSTRTPDLSEEGYVAHEKGDEAEREDGHRRRSLYHGLLIGARPKQETLPQHTERVKG